MKLDETIEFIECSFIKELVCKGSITDISYNGKDVYYVDNDKGRNKSTLTLTQEQAKDFIRQIANMCEKQFSYQNPYLDVSVGKYRINAVHQSIGKRNNVDSLQFSIRICSNELLIKKDGTFFGPLIAELIEAILSLKMSIVIGGITGTGKTEFQKYLISRMSEHTRIIAIDNILELDSLSDLAYLDLNIWQCDERNPLVSIQRLVKNALRCNPDWIIVAESRGEEMVDVLNSSLTGHPVMTTIHSYDLETMPKRIARMAMMGNKNSIYDDTLLDLSYHMKFYFYLKKEVCPEGNIKRFVSSIGFLSGDKMELLYSFDGKKAFYGKFPKDLTAIIKSKGKMTKEFEEKFLGEKE